MYVSELTRPPFGFCDRYDATPAQQRFVDCKLVRTSVVTAIACGGLPCVASSKVTRGKAIVRNMGTQLNTLYRTTATTRGATLLKARKLYLVIIRSSLNHGAVSWHRPDLNLKDSAKLTPNPSKCGPQDIARGIPPM